MSNFGTFWVRKFRHLLCSGVKRLCSDDAKCPILGLFENEKSDICSASVWKGCVLMTLNAQFWDPKSANESSDICSEAVQKGCVLLTLNTQFWDLKFRQLNTQTYRFQNWWILRQQGTTWATKISLAVSQGARLSALRSLTIGVDIYFQVWAL